jgi:hypothetical protein
MSHLFDPSPHPSRTSHNQQPEPHHNAHPSRVSHPSRTSHPSNTHTATPHPSQVRTGSSGSPPGIGSPRTGSPRGSGGGPVEIIHKDKTHTVIRVAQDKIDDFHNHHL